MLDTARNLRKLTLFIADGSSRICTGFIPLYVLADLCYVAS